MEVFYLKLTLITESKIKKVEFRFRIFILNHPQGLIATSRYLIHC